MGNKIKKSIIIGLIMSFMSMKIAFAQTKSNFNAQILNTHNQNEIIYLINEDGKLLKLNDGMNDIVPDNLPDLLSISVNQNNFIALTTDNEIISSINFDIPKGVKVLKIDGEFILMDNGKVLSSNKQTSKFLKSFEKIFDINSLSNNVVLLYGENGKISIVGDGSNGITVIRDLINISEIVLYDDILFIIRNDGKVVGLGNGYEKFSSKVESIINAKKFIKEDENLYVLTTDNNLVPISEKYFKAPEEYLVNIESIVIDKFSSEGFDLYKSYFITTDGKLIYYIQSNKEISEFNKNKIEYLKTFDNVKTVYESGYLTIVLHRDGSINIPYDIDHELNGVTGVKDVILKNQSYVVYFDDGQVITSLDNFVLNKKENLFDNQEELNLYNYFGKILGNILNRDFSQDEFKMLNEYLIKHGDKFEKILRDVLLDRRFLMIDYSYDDIINILYQSVLNISPSEEDYNYIKNEIVDKMENKLNDKYEILNEILNYVFRSYEFKSIINKIK